MKIIFSEHAWDDYLYWQRTDRKILERINKLIKEIYCERVKTRLLVSPFSVIPAIF